MAYLNKEIDHQKRKNQEGSYSVYNYMYRYLMDNYEPAQLDASIAAESAERKLIDIGKQYCIKGGQKINEDLLAEDAKHAVASFLNNDGTHGDTAHNLGKRQANSLNNIKRTLSDLSWW